MKQHNLLSIKNVVLMGMFGALSAVLMLFDFPIPFIAPSFYTLDLSEIPVLIGTFSLGPVAGAGIELVKILVKLVLKPTSTGFVGEFANVCIGCSLILPAGLIYQFKKTKKGAIIMDTAGYDISSVTSMVAGGCQAIVFTTGRGTPTGNAIVPVIKVTGNKLTYQRMEDNMDVDVSGIVDGACTIRESGKQLFDEFLEVCNGKMTKAEAYGFSDIAVDHVCRFV